MPKKAGSTDSTTKKTSRKPAARKSAPVVETPAAVETVAPAAVVKAEPVVETVAVEAVAVEAVAEPVAETAAVEAVAEPVAETAAVEAAAEPVAETAAVEAVTEPVAETVAETAPAPTAKRVESTVTVVVAKYDVGFGNSLYIRGEGAGLSWETGILMENVGNDVWVWTTSEIADEELAFKFLVNDESWSAGDNLSAAVGETTTLYPCF